MVMEDLQHIIPDQIKRTVADRKVYVILGAIIGGLVLVVVILASLMTATHVQALTGPSAQGQTGGNLPQCLTSSCLGASAWLSRNMDTSVAPCDNFYKYACGGWESMVTVPADDYELTTVTQLWRENEEKLRELVLSRIRDKSEESSERKLKEFFQSCVHDYGRMKEGGKVIVDAIKTKLKGWYVFDKTNWKTNWDLSRALVTAQTRYMTDALFTVDVYPDSRNYDENIITLRYGGLGMWYGYYHRDDKSELQDAYQDYMRAVGALLLRDANITMESSERAQVVEQFVQDAYSQELHLAQLLKTARKSGGFWRSRYFTIDQLSQNITQVNWLSVFRGIYNDSSITGSTEIQVRNMPYFVLMDQLLQNETTEQNRDRIMNNYMVWRLVATYSDHLSWEYKHAGMRYFAVYVGREDFKPTWETCLRTVRQRLGSALAAEFLNNHFTIEGRDEVTSIINTIKQKMLDNIDSISWMDNTTKSIAKKKVSSIESLVGFPDTYFDQNFVNNLHIKLKINISDGYLTNLMNANYFVRTLENLERKAGVQHRFWQHVLRGGGFGVTPYYFDSYNLLTIPAGALQYPWYHINTPKFMDYGAIGSYVAAELNHAINEYGRYGFPNGSYGDWWTIDTHADYLKQEDCIIDYVRGLEAGPYLVNGDYLTVRMTDAWGATRVADELAGIKISFQAYRNWTSTNGELHPPGLNMTNEQAFFVASTQTWCAKVRDENAYEWAQSGYVPDSLMINAALSHYPEFISAFRCTNGTKMWPKEQCNVY